MKIDLIGSDSMKKKPNEWLEQYKLNDVLNRMQYEMYELPNRVLFRYEWIVLTGFVLFVLAMSNELGYTNFSGDLFWALCGAALAGEGIVELYYEKRKQGE